MLNAVLTEIDKNIEDVGYDSFAMIQNMENICDNYEKIMYKDIWTKIAFLKEHFGTQFTDEQYRLIMKFGNEMYSSGYNTGFFDGFADGIADERDRQDY